MLSSVRCFDHFSFSILESPGPPPAWGFLCYPALSDTNIAIKINIPIIAINGTEKIGYNNVIIKYAAHIFFPGNPKYAPTKGKNSHEAANSTISSGPEPFSTVK